MQQSVPIISDEAKDFLQKLLCKNIRDRITLVDAQCHQWFTLSEEDILRQVDLKKQ